MIDLNTLISNALVAAVQQAVAPLNERIAKLESCNAEHHQRLLVLEGALTDRVVALEDQAIVTSNRINDRIAALENNPAQGVEPAITIDEARMVEALNSQEWFWEKLQNKIDASVEQSMDHHLECYDHDNYDEMASKVYEADFDEFMTSDNLNDAINEALEQATIRISI